MMNRVLTKMLLGTYLVDLAPPACPSAPEQEGHKAMDVVTPPLSVFAADYHHYIFRPTYNLSVIRFRLAFG